MGLGCTDYLLWFSKTCMGLECSLYFSVSLVFSWDLCVVEIFWFLLDFRGNSV